jgi:hypothetical protein
MVSLNGTKMVQFSFKAITSKFIPSLPQPLHYVCFFWVPSMQDALASIENGICAHTLLKQPYLLFISHPASLLFPNPQLSSQWWQ